MIAEDPTKANLDFTVSDKLGEQKVGGNRTDLQNAINAGKKNKRIFGVNDNEQLHYMGEPVTVASLLASSAPIISKVVTVLDEAKKISDMVEGVTSKVESTKSLIEKANNGFKKTTGIDVANVIFKKEEGVNINTTTLTPGMFKTRTSSFRKHYAHRL